MTDEHNYADDVARLRARWPDAVVKVDIEGICVEIGRLIIDTALCANGWYAHVRRAHHDGVGQVEARATVEEACDGALCELVADMERMARWAADASARVAKQVQAMTAAPTTGRTAADGGG